MSRDFAKAYDEQVYNVYGFFAYRVRCRDDAEDLTQRTFEATLSSRGREIVALRFGGELTGPEIAELTGLTLANVQQILSRSLRRLRAALEDRAIPGGEPQHRRP